jgi:hypothetical protein
MVFDRVDFISGSAVCSVSFGARTGGRANGSRLVIMRRAASPRNLLREKL